MSNVYDMSGKKKVIFTDKIDTNLTYKEIMTTIIQHATEEGCHRIFCDGGVNMCPSDVFGSKKIDKQKEENACEYEAIGCARCWTDAIKKVEELRLE